MAGRILVIRGGALGDFLLTLPAIRLLRENFPDAELEIMGYRSILQIVENRFYTKKTRSIEYSAMAGFFTRGATLDPELQTFFSSFDQVVSYLYDPDSIFLENMKSVGVRGMIQAPGKIRDTDHAAVQLARPLEQLALFLDDPGAQIFPSKEDLSQAANLLEPLGVLENSRILAVHPGSGGKQKNIAPPMWWQALADFLQHNPDARLLLLFGEVDRDEEKFFRSTLKDSPHTQRVLCLSNQPLPILAALLARIGFYAGHDSGISHLAAAAGAKCALFFGPTDPDIWAPANAGVRVHAAPSQQMNWFSAGEIRSRLQELLKE